MYASKVKFANYNANWLGGMKKIIIFSHRIWCEKIWALQLNKYSIFQEISVKTLQLSLKTYLDNGYVFIRFVTDAL